MKYSDSNLVFKGISWFVIIGLSMICCDDDAQDQRKLEWIENEVSLKVGNYRAVKMKECKARIWEEAEEYVDSLLANNDLFMEIVDEAIPTKPMKPNFVPLDTLILQEHHVERVVKN